jgi:hypothetical protein
MTDHGCYTVSDRLQAMKDSRPLSSARYAIVEYS